MTKILLAANAVALALVALAGLLAYLNKPGWGWVVLAAVICCVTPGKPSN